MHGLVYTVYIYIIYIILYIPFIHTNTLEITVEWILHVARPPYHSVPVHHENRSPESLANQTDLWRTGNEDDDSVSLVERCSFDTMSPLIRRKL